jgi:pyroglutamyl-peptidase
MSASIARIGRNSERAISTANRIATRTAAEPRDRRDLLAATAREPGEPVERRAVERGPLGHARDTRADLRMLREHLLDARAERGDLVHRLPRPGERGLRPRAAVVEGGDAALEHVARRRGGERRLRRGSAVFGEDAPDRGGLVDGEAGDARDEHAESREQLPRDAEFLEHEQPVPSGSGTQELCGAKSGGSVSTDLTAAMNAGHAGMMPGLRRPRQAPRRGADRHGPGAAELLGFAPPGRPPGAELGEPDVLLLAFEGYGGRGVNPSEEIVRALDGRTVAGAEVAGRVMPVAYDGLAGRIEAAIRETEPPAVIALGLWPGEPMIRIERIAANANAFEIPDNGGRLESGPVEPGGPDGRLATLPVEAIRDALLAARIPARVSGTAGAFLCNATMYTLLGAAARQARPPRAGFVHVPYLPSQVAGLVEVLRDTHALELHQRGDLASMELDTMVRAVSVAIETTLAA